MHDSRGAVLNVGDRVLIEAEITRLNTEGDENYCCVDVKIVTPETDFDKVMSPPTLGALSTKMLTKVGKSIALACLLLFAPPVFAQGTIRLAVPADAQVWMDGQPTRATGTNRVYVTPTFQGTGIYTLKIRVGGRETVRDLQIRNGQAINVAWQGQQGEMLALPPRGAQPLPAAPFRASTRTRTVVRTRTGIAAASC